MDNVAIFNQITKKIILAQELIIGPIAWEEARKVQGLKISAANEITFDNSDPENLKTIVNRLVGQYEQLFGKIADEVCKEAAASLVADLTPGEIPSTLR